MKPKMDELITLYDREALRDSFARAALPWAIPYNREMTKGNALQIARECYAIADAMLEAREK